LRHKQRLGETAKNANSAWEIDILIYTSYDGIGIEFERKKQHFIGFPMFKLAANAKHPIRLTR